MSSNKPTGFPKKFRIANPVFGCIMIVLIFACSSCKSRSTNDEKNDNQPSKKTLEDVNIMMLEAESQEIDDFISRYGWEAGKTDTGLRYYIYEHGEGRQAAIDLTAVISYEISLLSGDVLYTSEKMGPRHFQIGKGGVESGLEEGIRLLRVGDRAKFILPAHLAHGVPGDGVKIPRRSAIVYDVKLLDLY